MIKYLLIFFCFLALGGTDSFATTTTKTGSIALTDQGAVPIFDRYLYLEDSDKRVNINNISQALFAPAAKGKTSYSGSDAMHWLKFELENRSTNTERWYITTPSTTSKILNMYLFSGTTLLETSESGYSVPLKGRRVPRIHPAFPLTIPLGETRTIYIQSQSAIENNLDFVVFDKLNLEMDYSAWQSALGSYVGLILALIIFNLVLWLNLRIKAYLYYVLFMASLCSLVIISNQIIEPFLPIPMGTLREFYPTSVAITDWTALLFMRSFLQTKIHLPRADKLASSFMWFTGILSLLSLLDMRLGPILDPVGVLVMALIIYCSIKSFYIGLEHARIFLLAWGIFISFIIIWMLGKYGIIANNFWIYNLPTIGNMCEALLMSAALGQRIKALNLGKIAAEIHARDRDRFQELVRILCHDIANPLSVIKASAEQLPHVIQNRPEAIEKNIERMIKASNSIQQILERARNDEVERSTKRSLTKVSIKEIFDTTYYMFEDRLKQKQLSLVWQCDEHQASILADKISFSNEIINNLVSNAIKFCHKNGTIIFDVSQNHSTVTIRIIDNGIGIPASQLPHIFNESKLFSRLGTANEPGTGFGMSLVKSFVKQFDGKIEVSSSEDPEHHGTTVTMQFPIPS